MWVLFALAGLVVFAAGTIAGYLLDRSARSRDLFDAQIAAFEKQITANRAPKHAARSPRKTAAEKLPDRPGRDLPLRGSRPAPAPSRRLARDPGGPWYWKHPAPGTTLRARAVTTAADIAPVFLPAPGVSIPLRPQPARDSGTGTGTLPRLTDTGELRAATDAFIARLQRDGAAYRQEMTS